MKEKRRLKVAVVGQKLVESDRFIRLITQSDNSDVVIDLPDDYPKFQYQSGRWLKKCINENLWDFQRDLFQRDIDTLDGIISLLDRDVFDVQNINTEALNSFCITRTYRYNASTNYDYYISNSKRSIQEGYAKIIAQMIIDGKNTQSIDDNAFVFDFCEGIESKEYSNISWIVDAFKRTEATPSAKMFENLLKFSTEQQQILPLLYKKSQGNITVVGYEDTNFDNPTETVELLNALTDSKRDVNIATILSNNWVKTGSHIELEKFLKNISSKSNEYVESLADTPYNATEYLNVLFGNRFDGVSMSGELMRYVFNFKKNGFLKKVKKLIAEGAILSIAPMTMLDLPSFRQIINLNELSESDIVEADELPTRNCTAVLENLVEFEAINGRKLTPKEFFTLVKMPNWVSKLYVNLKMSSIDENLIRIKELPNSFVSEDKIDNLLYCLRQKRFSAWKKEFSYINNLEKKDVMRILINWDYLKGFMSEIQSVDDIEFLLKNQEDEGSTLEEKKNLYLAKEDNLNLLKEIGVTPEDAKEFALKGNLEIVKAYNNSVRYGEYTHNLKKIAKAEILGKLDVLKYADLDKEIGADVPENLKSVWIANTSMSKDGYKIAEYDDFKSIMIIGEKPVYSCQSYKSGRYNECLLSNFDANKKIIYVTRNGEYLARAILRFTKASDSATSSGLSFMDVTSDTVASSDGSSPKLCLFLEKPYIKNNISQKEQEKLIAMMKELAVAKAEEMGVKYYCNTYYQGEELNKYIYISRSKNGAQYLDSLTGNVSVQDEAKFVKAHVVQ